MAPKNIADLLVGGSAEDDEKELEEAITAEPDEDDDEDGEATEETSEDTGRQGDERDVSAEAAGGSDTTEEVDHKEEVKPKADKVDYGALHEERKRRQELQSQVDQMEKTYQALVQRINQPDPEPEIDYQDDPAGYIKQQQQKLERQVVELNEHREQQSKQQQLQQQQRQLAEAVSADEARFAGQAPDYNDRVSSALQVRMTQLQQFGFTAQEAQHTVREEVQFLVGKALNSERSPAEALYAMATAMAPAQKPAPQVVKPNPLQAAQAASKSLSRAGTATTQTDTSLKRLSGLKGADFDSEFEKLFPKSKKTSRITRPQ